MQALGSQRPRGGGGKFRKQTTGGPALTTGRAALFAPGEAFEAPGRRSRRPWDQSLFSVDGTRPQGGGWPNLTSLPALPHLQRLLFFFLSSFPSSASALLCAERSCVMLEFFSRQTKEPSCGAGCCRKAAGFLRADGYRGRSSAAKVGPPCVKYSPS